MPETPCPRSFIFMVKLKDFACQKLWYILAGPCFWMHRASEDSGLNPGKIKQIFNSHINGVFSTSRDRQDNAPPQSVIGPAVPLLTVPVFPWARLMVHGHVLITRGHERSRESHTPLPRLPGPGQRSKLWLRLCSFRFWAVPYHKTCVGLSPVNR